MAVDIVLDLLRCPHCSTPFVRVGSGVRCSSGHAYDVARQGHLNLLGRATPQHADTAAMVAARERFLGTGAYAAVAGAIGDLVGAAVPQADTLLDVGAGPGYYLAAVLDRVGRRGLALDISPYAARRAAQADPRIGSVVADAWAPLPVVEAGVDVLLSVFAPRQPAEFARVMSPGGVVVIVSPLEDHLLELRSELGLLDVEPGKQDRIAATMAAEFEAVDEFVVRDRIALPARAALDLVLMGPNAFHTVHQQLVDQVAALGPTVEVTVVVSVRAWRRRE